MIYADILFTCCLRQGSRRTKWYNIRISVLSIINVIKIEKNTTYNSELMTHEQNTVSLCWLARMWKWMYVSFLNRITWRKKSRIFLSLSRVGCSNFIKIIYANISRRYLASTANPLYQDWRKCASSHCHRPLVFWKARFLYSHIDSINRYEYLTEQMFATKIFVIKRQKNIS